MENRPATAPREGLSSDQKRYLALALSRLGINVTDAAAVVGVSRPTFYSYTKGESDAG
jgi:transcriptional regulator of acetoin/glycerol metabolism